MATWTVAAVSSTIFMSLYDSEDFRQRLNMKIAPTLEYKLVLIFIMVGNCLFCYCWEVFFLDGLCFGKILPWYKEKIRGPHLPYEHLEEELKCKPGWPPVGNYKNNETKIGEFFTFVARTRTSNFTKYLLPSLFFPHSVEKQEIHSNLTNTHCGNYGNSLSHFF